MTSPSKASEQRLAQILIQEGCLSADEISRAKNEALKRGLSLRDAIIAMDLCVEDQINWAVSRALNIPFVMLSPDMVNENLLQYYPATVLREHLVVPIPDVLSGVTLVMADPLNEAVFEMLKQSRSDEYQLAVAARSRIQAVLERFLPPPPPDAALKELRTAGEGSGILGAYKLLVDARKLFAQRILLRPAGDGIEAAFRLERGWVIHQAWPHSAALAIMTRLRLLAGLDAKPRGDDEQSAIFMVIGGERHWVKFHYIRETAGDTMTIELHAIQHCESYQKFERLLPQHRDALNRLFSSRRPSGVIIVNAPDERQRFRMIYGLVGKLADLRLDILVLDDARFIECENVRRQQPESDMDSLGKRLEADIIAISKADGEDYRDAFANSGERLYILGADFVNANFTLRAIVEEVRSRVTLADRLRAIWCGRRVDLNCTSCGGIVDPNRGSEAPGLCGTCNGYGRVRGTDLFEVVLTDQAFREKVFTLDWMELSGEVERMTVSPSIEAQLWEGIMKGTIFSQSQSSATE